MLLKPNSGLDKRYGDSAPVKSTSIYWYAEFKRGRANTT